MAEIIPVLGREVLSRMTSGERRFASRLKTLLEDDYTIWYDIPIGRQQRYPDFIVLHPSRGLLFIEVKDWKRSTLKKINKDSVELLTPNGLINAANPFSQVRQYLLSGTQILQRDPLLQRASGKHKGKLLVPYGYGVVFTNITRSQIEEAIPEEYRQSLLPDHLTIYKDEMTESVEAEAFQQRLWHMFNQKFNHKLTLPQLNRIRWHLFPEVRIDAPSQTDLFDGDVNSDDDAIDKIAELPPVPDIVRILDIQQEQLARGLGDGHRVIHGVAGSGKTLILGFRAQFLAEYMAKPILVLCYNTSLAAKLRSFVMSKGISEKVQVYHFHDWCAEQLRYYHVSVDAGDAHYWERQVASVIKAVDSEAIPRAQYGAVLIDEGHDFEAEWLKLITQMIDPETNSLLLLYDDAQSIYKKKNGLGFTLSSVGINASGRTSILRLNYRNTKEILDFAYRFAKDYFVADSAAGELPIVAPESVGCSGPIPQVHVLSSLRDELDFCIRTVQSWNEQDGLAWRDMAIIYTAGYQGKTLSKQMADNEIPHLWMSTKAYKQKYDPAINRVTLLTLQSSKGLEFERVILFGIDKLDHDHVEHAGRLLYVGMTRALNMLHISCGSQCRVAERLLAVAN